MKVFRVLFFWLLVLIAYSKSSGIKKIDLPCLLRQYEDGFVCVCNQTYCDTLTEVNPKGIEVIFVSSSAGGLRFDLTKLTFNNELRFVINDYTSRSERHTFEPTVTLIERNQRFFSSLFRRNRGPVKITVDRNTTYQSIVGFGGAFTTAVSYNLDKLDETIINQIYKTYFNSDEGIGYNFLRITIGGCDFDLEPWAYNELPQNDVNLSNFTQLDQRDEIKVKKIKDLMKITNNYDIKIIGSAWSPPPWMKSNNKWTGFSHLKTEYYQAWANYHIRFMELMAAKNISLWAITSGNEPGNGNIGALFVHFMSLGWTAETQAVWVANNMGPTLRNSPFKNVKLLGPDDQRYVLPDWLSTMDVSSAGSTSYFDGVAVHWYWDKIISADRLDQVHQAYPNKLILNTESCVGDQPLEVHGPVLGSWQRAEKYITSYIEDLRHWVNGWIDWNLILNEQGGPNYVDNYVDAPIIVNTTSGNEFYKQPIFYGIGHFSKFIKPDSIRIKTDSNDKDVETVGFKRPDGAIVLIVYNAKTSSIDVDLSDTQNGDISLTIPPKSVHTMIYK